MSHFSVLVIVPAEGDVERAVQRLLAPYEEELGINPKWDWWVIGGRWTGLLDGYKPEKDPANIEPCSLCRGTGIGVQQRRADASYTCNGCQGKGRRLKWPTEWARHEGDVSPVSSLPEKLTPFAVVTPDGEWHEKGKMGWWATVADAKDQDQWDKEVRGIIAANQGAVAVVVDCHI